MDAQELPSFEDATAQLQAFLGHQQHSQEIVWICREDVFQQWPKLYVKVPLPNESSLAEKIYKAGVRRGLGVEISVCCFVTGLACCYVWIPKDEIDAEYRMLHGLKLKILEPSHQITVSVKSRIRWFWIKFWGSRDHRRTWTEEIPQRNSM